MIRTTVALIIVFVATCGLAFGQDGDTQQQKYFEFWKPHAGKWTIRIEESGKDDITGTFSYRPSPTKLCYVSRGYADDGSPVIDGLYGYDSGRKCWVDVEIFKTGNSYIYYTTLLRADLEEKLHAGSSVSIDVTESLEGTTTRHTATRVYKVLEKDRIVMVHTNRKTAEGASLPDLVLSFERTK